MTQWHECSILQSDPTEVPGCWYVLTEGHLDAGPPLMAWETHIKKLIDDGARWIIFDTRKIKTYVDLGHGALVMLSGRLRDAGGGAILLAMDKRNRFTFELLKIDAMFHFAETMDEALTIARGDAD
ncbi:MAG: hypothetical protein KDB90_01955 [Planctomycetes bacterium]|nr:hypothetical protein [Planctomycetota bacterium]